MGNILRVRRWLRGVLLAVPLVLLLPAVLAHAQAAPTPLFQSKRVPVADRPSSFDETLFVVLDFAPGAWTPLHTHGGATLVAVLDGELTRRMGDHETVYHKGDVWTERPGEAHAAGNKAQQGARAAVTFLLPRGATPTTPVGQAPVAGAPGPTTVYQSKRLALAAAPAAFDETLFVQLQFAPGAWTPQHHHGGLTLVTVLEGELTRRAGASTQTYAAGDSWAEVPHEIHAAGNEGGQDARALVTFLLPTGATPTTNVAAPTAPAQVPATLPRTGGPAAAGLILGVLGLLSISAGALAWRWHRSNSE